MSLNHSPSIVTSGLQLLLDAANTKSYPGSGTTWTDLSGNINNGTLVASPTYSSLNNGYFTFNGTTQYLTAGSASLTSRPFSISIWIYFNSISGFQTFIGQDTSQAITEGAFYFQKNNSNFFGLVFYTSANARIEIFDTAAVTTGVWYNFCVSVSTTGASLYKNGISVNTISNSATLATLTGNLAMAAGYWNNGIVDYVNARIGQVSIYNIALSEIQAEQNFNALRGRYSI